MGACLDIVEEACISKSYLTRVLHKFLKVCVSITYLTRVVYELHAIKTQVPWVYMEE